MGVKRYCVDGTNLVRTAYGYAGTAHQEQENADTERIVEIFARLCEDAGSVLEVELFFDGAYRAVPASRSDNFHVSFSGDVSADELILDRVRALSWNQGGQITVVTADGDLGRSAEDEGGKWMRVSHGTSPESVARKMGGRFFR